MSVTTPIVTRVTKLTALEGEARFWLVHPADALFDIAAFNAAEGVTYLPEPPPHPNGVALDDEVDPALLLVDDLLREAQTLSIWRGESYEHCAASEVQAGQPVQACVALPGASGSDDLQQIHRAVTTFTERRIEKRLDETLDIPPLPEAATRIVALQSDPNYDLKDLVQIVETDPSIAAKVVSWANSAFYAPDPPARSLDDAIMRVLGFDLVMNLALGLVLSGTLRLPESAVRGAPPFWLKSVFTAAAMEAIGSRLPADVGPSAGSCYLTGLLAHFGTLVVGHVFPPQYEAICRLEEANPHLPTNVIDEHVLELSREVIASALLEQWDLPNEIVTAVRHQHTTGYTGQHAAWVQLLQLANEMMGSDAVIDQQRLNAASVGLAEEDLEAVVELLSDSRDELEGLARAVA